MLLVLICVINQQKPTLLPEIWLNLTQRIILQRKLWRLQMPLITTNDGFNTPAEEALAAWINYQATGLHLTGKEVQDWLATWGTPEEHEIPQCRN